MNLGTAVLFTLLASPASNAWLPTLRAATTPQIPITALEGDEVRLEAQLAGSGAVTDVRVLRHTPPFTEVMVDAVKGWQFQAAASRQASRALIVGLFLAPMSFDEEAPEVKDASASPDVPSPHEVIFPPSPANIVGDTVVILEVDVTRRGITGDVRVVAGEAPFADLATQSVQQWTFRPAERDGQPVPGRVWVVAGFRPPIIGGVR